MSRICTATATWHVVDLNKIAGALHITGADLPAEPLTAADSIGMAVIDVVADAATLRIANTTSAPHILQNAPAYP